MVIQTAQVKPKPIDIKQKSSTPKADKEQDFSEMMSQVIQHKEKAKSQFDEKTDELTAENKAEVAEQTVSVVQNSEVNILAALVPLTTQTASTAQENPVITQQTQAQNVEQSVITGVSVNVKQMQAGDQSQGAEQALAQSGDPNSKGQTQIVANDSQGELSMNTTKTPEQPNSSKQKTEFANQLDEQVKSQPTRENVQDTKVVQANEDTQNQQAPSVEQEQTQSVQKGQQVSEIETNAGANPESEKAKVNADTAKESQIPVDKVADTSVKTQQPDFAQEVKAVEKPQTTEQKEVVNQVLSQIGTKFNTKTSEFSFNLYPADLGKVSVKMAVEDGMLIVEIAASNAKTQSVLAANAGEIKAILQSQSAQQQMQFVEASPNPQAHDYLNENQQNDQNQNNNQGNKQQTANEENDQSTTDFLSVMQLVNSARISEGW
ncbi:MAG: flagellar hook-length control protein FliK [Oscillospiraceae bacterium]